MYRTMNRRIFLPNETNAVYYKRSAANQYITGNSFQTYCIVKEVSGQEAEGHWLLLFGDSGMLKHGQRLGDVKGFGDVGTLLQITRQHQCASIVLASHALKTYTACKADLQYHIGLIAAANRSSICLLDHIVSYPEGYYSYRDNDLLTYLS